MSQTVLRVEGGNLIITIPLNIEPILSKSGKSFTVASTSGNQRTQFKLPGNIKGKNVKGKNENITGCVTIGVNAYVERELTAEVRAEIEELKVPKAKSA